MPLLAVAAPGPTPDLRVVNDANLPAADVATLTAGYRRWAVRVFDYLGARDVAPITLVFTPKVHVGLYVDDRILMPPDDDREDMEETFIHELTHHVTGHDSTYFFKEGLATHVLEKLLAEDHRAVEGWPQYTASNDDWVRLFAARGQLPPLAEAMAWPSYDGTTPEQDYRSWQVYAIGGSFAGWYIGRHGMRAYLQAFAAGHMHEPLDALEREWRAAVAQRTGPLPDPAKLLPGGARYRYYAQRLALMPAPGPSPAASPSGR